MRSRNTIRESKKNEGIKRIRIILAAMTAAIILSGCALNLIGVTSENTGLYIAHDDKGKPIVVDSKGERQREFLVDKDGNIATWDNRTITVLARYTGLYIESQPVIIQTPVETAKPEVPVTESRGVEDVSSVIETPVPVVMAVRPQIPAKEIPTIQNSTPEPIKSVPFQVIEYKQVIPVSTPIPVMQTEYPTPIPQREKEIPAERNIQPNPTETPQEEPVQDVEHDHVWEEVARQEASCTEAGTAFIGCRICGETRTETLNAEHVFDPSGVCLRCGLTDENMYRTFGRNLAQSGAGEYEKMIQIVDFVLINAVGNSCTGYSSKCMEAAEAAGLRCTARTVWDIHCPVTGCEHTSDSFDSTGYCRCGLGNNHTWVRFTLSDGFYEYDLQGMGRESPGRNTQIH